MSESWRFWRDALAGGSSRSDTWATSLRLLHSTNLPEPAARNSTRGSRGATVRHAPPQFVGCAFASGNDGARSRGAARPVKDEGGRAKERHSWKQTLPNPEPIEEGMRDLVHQCREFLIALCFPRDDTALHSLLSAWFL